MREKRLKLFLYDVSINYGGRIEITDNLLLLLNTFIGNISSKEELQRFLLVFSHEKTDDGYCKVKYLTKELIEAKKAINVLGGEIEKVDKFLLPNSDIERNIVVINPDVTYIDICDIFIDNGVVKIAIYNNIFNEIQILSITNIRLKNLRWDYIKVQGPTYW